MATTTYARQTWDDHMAKLQFRQGEHILTAAPTSAGKTTLIRPVLDKRKYTVCLFTKLQDETIGREFKGYKRYEEWPKHGFPTTDQKVMIWPRREKKLRDTVIKQKAIMAEAIDRIAYDGSWCVYIDEMLYMVDPNFMGLGKQIGMLHYFGRSSGVSAVTAAQRPFHIPRIILSSVTHGYFARTYDAGDQKRLSELGSINPKEVIENMGQLQSRHDFMYLNPQGDAPASIVNRRK